MPRSSGVSTASASIYTRALASYWFGIAATPTQPAMHTIQAAATPHQRRRHASAP